MGRTARALAPLLALLVLASACGSGSTGKGGGPAYVALGDSYTAGLGIDPVADAKCGRSSVDYPSLVAQDLKITSFDDRSCSGASTLELERPQTAQLVRLNAPQLDSLGRSTTLVTIGIGLNDDQIATGLFDVCLTPPGAAPSNACTQYLALPESTIEAKLQAAADRVAQSIEAIAAKAPKARIVLVGYPRLVPDQGTCPSRLPVPAAQFERLRDAIRFTDQAWRDAAEKSGASYVDMYSLSQGHDICSADPWVSDYKGVPGKSLSLHPFESYHRAVADQVVALVKHG